MPATAQWWTAITGGVGPAPTLAPRAFGETALAQLVATIHHPAGGPKRTFRLAERTGPE